MFWKKKNPLLKLRTDLLEGKLNLNHYKGKNDISAIITDLSIGSSGLSIIYIADGSCSLYFEKGGSIIGAGEHENIIISSTLYVEHIDTQLDQKVTEFETNFPSQNNVSIKIITKDGKFEIKESSTSTSKTFALANSLLTQFRLISENNNQALSNEAILFSYIKENNLEAVKMTLHKFQNPDATLDGRSALIIATYMRFPQLIDILKEAGADLDFREETDMNALMIASFLGYPELLEKLLSDKTIESKDSNGYTPLMFAANAGHFECVEKLISLNADINACDNDNSTPIMFAAQNGSDSIVKILKDHGAEINRIGTHGYSALSLAELNGNETTIAILKAL